MSTRINSDRKSSFWLALAISIWVVAALGTLIYVNPEFWKDGYSYFKDAQELAKQNKLSEAIAAMNKALGRDPDNSGYLTYRASLQEQSGDTTAAEQGYKNALSLAPDNAEAALGLGQLLLEQNRPQEALQTLDTLAKKTLSPELLLRRARLQAQYGQHPKAIADFKAFLARNPDTPDVLRQLAASAMAIKDYALAQQTLETYLQTLPEDETSWGRNQLIIALREQKKLEQAYALLTQSPTPDNLRQRAEIALELSRFTEAAPLFRALLAEAPDDPELKNKYAIAIRAIGGKEEAAQAFTEAPTPENLDERAQLAMELQRFDEAAKLYKELAAKHPGDSEIKNQLAVALRALKRREEAYKLFTEASTPENLDERAQLAMELQRFDDAAKLYKELAAKHPGDSEIKNQLAVALRALKRREEAYKLFTEAPTPENLDERAQLAMELQRFDDAAKLYKELAAKHPGDSEIKNQLAVALRALKRREEAYKLFTEAPTPENLDERAQLAMELQRFDDAAKLYKELAAKHPGDSEIKNQLAVALRALKRREEAYKLFTEAPTPENLDERAQLAMELQRFDDAAKLYKELAAKHPGDSEIKNQLAVALRALKRREEAYKLFTEAPTPENLDERAQLAMELQRFDDAAKLYKELAAKHPGDSEIKNQLAVALRALKRREEAYKLFTEAPTPENLDERAQLAMELQRFDEAAKLYKELAAKHPGDSEIKNQLAVALRALKRLEKAYKLFTEAPTPENLKARAELALQLKHYEAAAELYGALAARYPDDAKIKEHLAYALDKGSEAAGKQELAANEYEKLITSGRASDETRIRYAWLLMREKRYDEAYELMANMPADDAALLRLKAEAAFLSKHFVQAIPLLQQLSRSAPEDATIWENLAAAFDALKQPAEAAEALHRYLALSPDSPDATARLAGLLQRTGQTREAIRLYKQVLAANPKDVGSLKALAGIYESQNRYAAALALLQRLVKTHPADSGLTIRIARLYKWKKDYSKARNWFRRALAMKLPGKTRYRTVMDLAETELELGDAAAALKRLNGLHPGLSDNPRLLELQARSAMAAHEPAQAVAALQHLDRIRKLTPKQRLLLAGQLRLLGEKSKALAIYEALHKQGSLQTVSGLEALGDLRLDAGRPEDALRAYLAIPEKSLTQQVYLKIARSADRAGDKRRAAKAYEQYLAAGKASPDLLLETARFMIKAGKYERGLALFDQALTQRNPQGLELELAQANLAAKRFKLAEQWATKAVATDSSNWKAVLALVQALHLQGKSLQADNLLQKHEKSIIIHPKGKEWMGYVAIARDRHMQAFRIFDELIHEGAGDPGNLWLWRGVAATRRGDYARAEKSFAQARRFTKSGRPTPNL